MRRLTLFMLRGKTSTLFYNFYLLGMIRCYASYKGTVYYKYVAETACCLCFHTVPFHFCETAWLFFASFKVSSQHNYHKNSVDG